MEPPEAGTVGAPGKGRPVLRVEMGAGDDDGLGVAVGGDGLGKRRSLADKVGVQGGVYRWH